MGVTQSVIYEYLFENGSNGDRKGGALDEFPLKSILSGGQNARFGSTSGGADGLVGSAGMKNGLMFRTPAV